MMDEQSTSAIEMMEARIKAVGFNPTALVM